MDQKRPVESYARLYDDILENEKIALLSPAAFGLYCAMISYCHRNDTDGVILITRAKALLDFDVFEYADVLGELQPELVGQIDGVHLEVHDYLLHNHSHAEREAAKKARHDQASHAANARWHAPSNAQSMPKVKEKEKGEGLVIKEPPTPYGIPAVTSHIYEATPISQTLKTLKLQSARKEAI